MVKSNLYFKFAASLVFTIAAFLFWFIGYRQALSYQEEFQLFLFDWDYFVERMLYPGGFAVFLGEFLTQFFVSLPVGGFIVAALYLALQLLTWSLARKEGATDSLYVFSFVPVVALWCYMGDENAMLGFVVGIIMTLGAVIGYVHLPDNYTRVVAVVLGLPVLFWLCSSAAYVAVVCIVVNELRHSGLRDPLTSSALVVIYMVAIVVVAYHLSAYPLDRVAMGINFYRFRQIVPYGQFIVMAIFALVPMLMGLDSVVRLAGKLKPMMVVAISLVVVFVGAVDIRLGFDGLKYDIMEYDYLLRTHKWDDIIARAEKKGPTEYQSPTVVSTVNLALAFKGQLADRMFEFYQRGEFGLMPKFSREMTTTVMASEIYFYLGMINTSQRFVFEAMESIPNNQKSGRIMRRLVETNIINGCYDVARRYINVLKKSYAYRRWAIEMETYLGNEEMINKHPIFGPMRAFRVGKDFFYSENEADQMLGMLFVHCNSNRMALEYLLGCEILKFDFTHFMQYYQLTSQLKNYTRIPRSYQETMVYVWSQNHPDLTGIPVKIDGSVIQMYNQFRQYYSVNKNNPQLQNGPLAKTVWNYFLFERK